jgi:hypothetical protein
MLTRDREIGRSLFQAPPEDRALLDLSVRRKVKDEVVAAVLRLQREEVAPRREAALDRLADQLGMHDHAERARLPELLAELPADQWPDDNGSLTATAPPPAEPPPAAKPEPEPDPDPDPEPDRRRRRPMAAIVVIVIGALLGGFIGLLFFGGDSEDDGDSGNAPAASAPAPAPAPESVDLQPVLAGFPARGTARIEGSGANSRLIMSLRDLPPREEAYAVWLYNSLTDAVMIDRVVGTRLDVDRVLPADPAGSRFIDVSREPIDDNPNHSGSSVLRVPVENLLKAR